VGLWSTNAAEWVVTQYAAAKVGAILVNINPAYRLRELEYALNHSGVSVLVAACAFRRTDYAAMLLELAPELRTPRRGPLVAVTLPCLKDSPPRTPSRRREEMGITMPHAHAVGGG
jgi:fatty-acyl-CoA synthase